MKTIFENRGDSDNYELPEIAERLILQAMEESDLGLVRPHDEVFV